MTEGRLSTTKLIAFAGPAIPIAALGLPLTVFVPQFFAGPLGLGLGVVGTIFMLARFWDMITDPIMGAVSDQISTRWGRRRHWIVLSVPILVLSVAMVLLPQGEVTPGYLLGWLIVLYIGWTMLTLSHLAWGAELSTEYNQRSRIQGFREGFVILGVPLVLLIPVAIATFGNSEELLRDQVAAMGWFVIFLLPPAVAISVWKVDEADHFKDTQTSLGDQLRAIGERLSFSNLREAIAPLKSNGALQRTVSCDFLNGFSGAALGTMFVYVVRHVWELGDLSGILLLVYFFAGLGFVPILLQLSYRLGKKKALIAAAGFNVCFFPFFLFLPPGEPLIAGAMLVFMGLNVGSMNILYRAIMADVGDIDEIQTGQRRTGLFYSLLTSSSKIGGALAVGVVFWALDFLGFQTSGENTPEAIAGLSYLFVGVPLVCNVIVVVIMWHFPIDLAKQEELRKIIEERKVEEWEADQGQVF